MSLFLVFRFLSTYHLLRTCLAFSFVRASLCRFTMCFASKMGILPLTVRLKSSSAGGTPVVLCGAVRYCNKNRLSSCFQDRPSSAAALYAFPSGCMKRSACALP